MTEQIDIQKHLEGLEKRVGFLKDWIAILKNQKTELRNFEIEDKIYTLQTEVNHKQHLIDTRKKDIEMFASQSEMIRKKVSNEMGTLIGKLRTARFKENKHAVISDTIIKRFSKNNYTGQQHQIADFKMAEALINEAPRIRIAII